MQSWSFDYTQWRKNTHGGPPIAERKTHTWEGPFVTDAEFVAARDEFLEKDPYIHVQEDGTRAPYPRTLIPNTSVYRELRRINDAANKPVQSIAA